MKIHVLPLGPLATNCYIVENGKEAIIFDPGGDSDKLVKFLSENQLTPISICLTHAHFDHIGAVEETRVQYKIPVYIHKNEAKWLMDANLNGSNLFQLGAITSGPADYFLQEGVMKMGSFEFEVRHVPGHSPGGVAFIFHSNHLIVGGDSLFNLGIGRTDLPGGNMHQLLESIQTQLFSLEDNYSVYPGHGPATTIGKEKKNNPFLQN